MPSHKHRYISDDNAGVPFRTGRPAGRDFSQYKASGSAYEYFTTPEFPKETGGDRAHNNMQPSIITHVWERIG